MPPFMPYLDSDTNLPVQGCWHQAAEGAAPRRRGTMHSCADDREHGAASGGFESAGVQSANARQSSGWQEAEVASKGRVSLQSRVPG